MASLSESRSQTTNDLLELTANYDKTIAEIHNLSLLLGLSQEENKYEDLSASGSDFENNSMSLMGHAKSNYSVGGTKTRSALRSLFGRVNYNYMIKAGIMQHSQCVMMALHVLLKVTSGGSSLLYHWVGTLLMNHFGKI